MGASQSSSPVIQVPVEEALFPEQSGFSIVESIHTDALVLKRYGFTVQTMLMPGSGRMMKTFQIISSKTSSTAVLKATWILEQPYTSTATTTTVDETTTTTDPNQMNKTTTTTSSTDNINTNDSTTSAASSTATAHRTATTTHDEDISWLEQQHQELKRIRQAVRHQTHVAPFSFAWMGETSKIVPRHWIQNRAFPGSNNRNRVNFHASSAVTARTVFLVRPHVHTTLADRLATRPWLEPCEKLWLVHQMLTAVDAMHRVGVVHGFLNTENIGLTSTGWVLLIDIASYKARTRLPDDDPSQYLYYFQPATTSSSTSTTSTATSSKRSSNEKRCYLAPERFYTPSASSPEGGDPVEPPLQPSMDIFSLGCVITELFLNGERCLDLGDLMEYRRANMNHGDHHDNASSEIIPPALQQKLNKIESSAVRAACKHMLALQPEKRLTAMEYRERLEAADHFPRSFDILTQLVERITVGDTVITPDARIAVIASQYGDVLWETMGVRDHVGTQYFSKWNGSAVKIDSHDVPFDYDTNNNKEPAIAQKRTSVERSPLFEEKKQDNMDDLLVQVESLLKDLDSLDLNAVAEDSKPVVPKKDETVEETIEKLAEEREQRSALCKSSLLIYIQIILMTIRHVQRPSSKLVALRLIGRLSRYASDEARLQRIVPVLVSLFQDQDPLVRALSVKILTKTLALIERFPPSDSKLFPQYIFKRVAHMISDPALVVRISFVQCIATLAETAQRFLDIDHAVRVYEAVGNGSSGTTSRDEAGRNIGEVTSPALFADNVAKLLDPAFRSPSKISLVTDHTEESVKSDAGSVGAGKILISSTYSVDLSSLHEIVSRWVVHVTTDQSDHASFLKRILLCDVHRFCPFFGLEGVMSFILPQILSFLNERKDWELRSGLFDNLPSVCYTIGRAATEEFVLPCVEIGLVDCEQSVICSSLACLSRIVEMGLLSRLSILGKKSTSAGITKSEQNGLMEKYGALLLFPSNDIRKSAIMAISKICAFLGSPDCEVFIVPVLRPFLRYEPSARALGSMDGLTACLKAPVSKEIYYDLLKEFGTSKKDDPWTAGAWTSIGSINFPYGDEARTDIPILASNDVGKEGDDLAIVLFKKYLRMLIKHTVQSQGLSENNSDRSIAMVNGIDGSIKLAQNVMFPRQTNGLFPRSTLPQWYASLRDLAESKKYTPSAATAVRSISTLGHVYGLSIMGPVEGTTQSIEDDAAEDSRMAGESTTAILESDQSRAIEASFIGQWGAEVSLDPEIVDTCLLITKLKALDVPPLPVKLGDPIIQTRKGQPSIPLVKHGGPTSGWKPRLKCLLATTSPMSGHTASVVRLAVSKDQSFFASGSHDGTCRIWEMSKVEQSGGVLESSIIYTEHSKDKPVRVNDIAMLEGTHAMVSGDSGGSVHVWRVDMVMTTGHNQGEYSHPYDRSRVAGSTSVRTVNKEEGEILTVSHFNSSSGSIVTFGTQKGIIHSWDMRCAQEPFLLRHGPDLGHLTSMAFGSDRNWIVAGTSKGYMALWDIRFQQCIQLWRHSREAPISRLATTSIDWESSTASEPKPYIFAASGNNECAMFNAMSGACKECFRTVSGHNQLVNARTEEPPTLKEVLISSKNRSGILKLATPLVNSTYQSYPGSINCMVGSIGAIANSYLITGGGDGRIRYWDFTAPSKCFVVCGQSSTQPRPSFERVNFEGQGHLMICRQLDSFGSSETNHPRKIFHGLKKPDNNHTDSIQDIKIIDKHLVGGVSKDFSALVSCSKDSTIKIWR